MGGGVLRFSSGPFLSYEIEIGDGPGPELDNCSDRYFFRIDLKEIESLYDLKVLCKRNLIN